MATGGFLEQRVRKRNVLGIAKAAHRKIPGKGQPIPNGPIAYSRVFAAKCFRDRLSAAKLFDKVGYGVRHHRDRNNPSRLDCQGPNGLGCARLLIGGKWAMNPLMREPAAVAARLKELRLAIGLGQSEIAAICNTDNKNWSNWENAVSIPKNQAGFGVCEGLGCGLDWLYYGNEISLSEKLRADLRKWRSRNSADATPTATESPKARVG